MKKLPSCMALLLCAFLSHAQLTQIIRGTVTDQVLQKPVAGALVNITGTKRLVSTDENGNFRFNYVPVGTVTLQVTSIGYKPNTVANITVNAGKEMVLSVAMQDAVYTSGEVVVKASSKKNKPLNDMSVVSARAFTVEEAENYAAAVNDPLRMATNFAGVASADDGNNQIVIRGNSPTGLLWKMEGVDIPNPNHFAAQGSTGGGISILSSQLLSNSDFVTGAFAAEYGNALSGVFDLKLRKGNNEKRETTLQAGLLGLNIAMEGPFNKNYKGSYLINYRYSTLSLLDKLGVNIGNASTTNFQDLSYNIYLPTKKSGNFSIFGFTGLSNQDVDANTDSLKWETESDRYGSKYISNTTFSGITHNINIGRNGKLNSAIGYSYNKLSYLSNYLEKPDSSSVDFNGFDKTRKLILNSTFSHRFNRKHTLKVGGIADFVGFNNYQISRENTKAPLEEKINITDNTATIQGFAEWQYKASDNLTFNAGLHYLRLLYNGSNSAEPRFSVKWDVNKMNSIAFGYGLHSQVQPWGIYLAQVTDNGKTANPNKDLALTKAQHFVVSYNHAFSKNLRLKAEAYYQQLFNVPVRTSDTNTISTLNLQDGYITDPLVNKGKGKNYGVELSLEKYLDNHVYFMFSNSLYKSKYTASDGIERNTRFNGNFISNLVAGKEFVYAQGGRTLGLNLKAVYAGGYRTIPIDIEQSEQLGYTVFIDKEAYSLQNPAYMRADIRISMKWNRKNFTSTLSLDIQNVTGRQNVYNSYYDTFKGKVVTNYQTGLIPVLNYKIEF